MKQYKIQNRSQKNSQSCVPFKSVYYLGRCISPKTGVIFSNVSFKSGVPTRWLDGASNQKIVHAFPQDFLKIFLKFSVSFIH